MTIQPIMIDGIRRARPERVVVRGADIWGLFPGEDDRPDSCDSWLCWGQATQQNLDALRRAGVRIDREEVRP